MEDIELLKQCLIKLILDSEFQYLRIVEPLTEFDKIIDEVINELSSEGKLVIICDRGFCEITLSESYKQELGIFD